MSTASVGQQVKFTIGGLLYEGTVTEERGDQLIINVIRQGGRETRINVMASRETVFSSQASQSRAAEDLLIKTGSGSGMGYAG